MSGANSDDEKLSITEHEKFLQTLSEENVKYVNSMEFDIAPLFKKCRKYFKSLGNCVENKKSLEKCEINSLALNQCFEETLNEEIKKFNELYETKKASFEKKKSKEPLYAMKKSFHSLPSSFREDEMIINEMDTHLKSLTGFRDFVTRTNLEYLHNVNNIFKSGGSEPHNIGPEFFFFWCGRVNLIGNPKMQRKCLKELLKDNINYMNFLDVPQNKVDEFRYCWRTQFSPLLYYENIDIINEKLKACGARPLPKVMIPKPSLNDTNKT